MGRNYEQLAESSDPSDNDEAIRKSWLTIIRHAALNIFDQDIAPEEAWSEPPKRLVFARDKLSQVFRQNDKVWKALELKTVAKAKTAKGKKQQEARS